MGKENTMFRHTTISVVTSGSMRQPICRLHPGCMRRWLLKRGVLLTAFLALPLLSSGAQSLHSFAGGADGAHPVGGLALGANGILYGTTTIGGTPPAAPIHRVAARFIR
jgi:hypothetical protein